jgi:nucleoside-diphosphate-sugar epimerase
MVFQSGPGITHKILVTGASGFIGRAVMEALRADSRNHSLIGVSRRPVRDPGRWIRCDLTDRPSTERLIRSVKPDIVLHLAGVPANCPKRELLRAYVQTTSSLFQAIHRHRRGRCRVVVAGSATEYGRVGRPDLPVREFHKAHPVTPYGIVKWKQTQLALSFHAKGIPVNIGRVFNLCGPGCPSHLAIGSWALQIKSIRQGRCRPVIQVGNLETKRDFLDVRDVGRALAALAYLETAGEIYNICSGRALAMSAVLQRLLDAADLRARVVVVHEARRLRARRVDVPAIYGNPTKIMRATRWKPRIPMRSSLIDTLSTPGRGRPIDPLI